MFVRFFGRQIAALTLALGIFLSGVGPSWAAPAVDGGDSMPGMAMTMSDMDMSAHCAEMAKSMPGKMPCKGTDSSCAVCTACAVNIGMPRGFSPVTLLYRGEVRAVSHDANRNSVATPPPLPHPILHA